ncbi:Calx-beta domain-containing protein [uncultured Thiothrix sp.]|uniref:beta strand repeat-containing protein n=1 Tax=uncultured Thiothrix sp. TaxID=223185 RepID=UPI00262F9B69|nr:Calx-beta domain-containing protein [uncultured Thiothrix sp.]
MPINPLLSSSSHWRLDLKQPCLSLAAILLATSLGEPAWAVDYTFSCKDIGGTNCPSDEFDAITTADGNSAPVVITSKITVPVGICPGGIADVNIFTDISTDYVNDIYFGVFAPTSFKGIYLVNRACSGQNNIQATFDDEAPIKVDDNYICSSNPAISGSVKPLDSLADLDGATKSPSGIWSLFVGDASYQDATKLNNWKLQLECIPQLSIAKVTDGAEPSTKGQFQVTVNPVNNTGAAITGMVTYSGTATKGIDASNGTDYIAPATFSIPNGASTVTLDFTIINDTEAESTETVIATISAPSNGSIGTATATANLVDNDTYTVSIAKTADGAEPSTNGQFTVTLSPVNTTGFPITGTVAYSGTATNGTDYNNAPVTFSIPQSASSATLDFTTIDDTAVEGVETVIATISAPSTGTISTATATANLADNDNYTLSIAKTTDGAEPSTNGQFTVTVWPANTSGAPITGTVAYTGTATSNTDYTAPPTSFNIPNGSSTATLNFAVIDDTAVEGTETVIATISNPSTGTITTATATTNLADNDAETNYQLSIAKTTDGAEPSTAGRFTVTLSPANATGAAITGTVAYSGTATNATDYTAPTSFSIPNGSSTATIDFAVIDDTAVEGNEAVIATLLNPSTGTITTAAATANLADNDAETNYTVSINKTTDGAEPSTNGQFTVTVSPANTSGVPLTGTVAYTGTATHGTDYTAPVSFNIPNGSSNANLPFSVINDNEAEGPETIIATINLTTPANNLKTARASTAELVNLGNNSASAVINDDDTSTPIPIFSPFSLLALLAGLAWLGWRRKA